ncbi:MAG: SEC-C metal-binding domain-containing protein [Chlamydiota bacterium]
MDNKKIKRNAPCHCGSGKKYKKCCLLNEGKKNFSATVLSSTNNAGGLQDRIGNMLTNLSQTNKTLEELEEELEIPEEKRITKSF